MNADTLFSIRREGKKTTEKSDIWTCFFSSLSQKQCLRFMRKDIKFYFGLVRHF